MLSVESHVQKFDLDEQWYTLGQADMDNMTWPDFVFKVSSLKHSSNYELTFSF